MPTPCKEVFGVGGPVDNRIDWVFLLLELNIAVRGQNRERERERKQTNQRPRSHQITIGAMTKTK